jgi:hypothetical protein
MSSAFLYVAIVGIWAFVLIPRWLRRPHLLGQEATEPQAAPLEETADLKPRRPVARARMTSTRAKVLQARRRLLTMLVTLNAVAGAVTYMKLTSWWACVPPGAMLCLYLLLLREASLADAERAQWRAIQARQIQAARHREHVVYVEESAEIIDISARLSDEPYDQYADATFRAVGD